jgi:hypothetical protein
MVSIDDVVKEEWRQFQLVNNEGGRAGCQDNPQEFFIMRKSQFMAWPQEIVSSYYRDLMKAKANGRNLLFEKYAFMMRETAPGEFATLQAALPELSAGRQQKIEQIVAIQVKWAEEFQEKYPAYSAQGRPIHSAENSGGTSIETYLRGELCSYGEETLDLYYEYVKKCASNGRNLTCAVRENMARAYGYFSLKDIEIKFENVQCTLMDCK